MDGGGRQDNGLAGAGRGGWPRLCPAGPFTFGPLERRVMCTSGKGKRLCLPWPYGIMSLSEKEYNFISAQT